MPNILETTFNIETLQFMQEVENTISSQIKTENHYTSKITSHLFNKKGKMIRPLLVFLSSRFISENKADNESLVKVAAAVEIIHTASLVHDDIIDTADYRRGQQSVNKEWSNSMAVLAGDFLFARAFYLLSLNRQPQVMKLMTEAISKMCEGEMEQGFNRNSQEYLLKNYYSQIRKKTASLLEACCLAGGILTGLSEQQLKYLQRYSCYLGYAYQIVDDILDITSSPKDVGKSTGVDIGKGIYTLPIILLLKKDTVEKAKLVELITKDAISFEDKIEIRNIVVAANTINQSLSITKIWIRKAKYNLCKLPGNEEGKEVMSDLANQVISKVKQ